MIQTLSRSVVCACVCVSFSGNVSHCVYSPQRIIVEYNIPEKGKIEPLFIQISLTEKETLFLEAAQYNWSA